MRSMWRARRGLHYVLFRSSYMVIAEGRVTMISSFQLPEASPSLAYAAVARSTEQAKSTGKSSDSEVNAAFQQFVGETFFQLMLKSLRNMHDKPAYLHGGQAETLFQGQLDQEIASRLAKTEVGSFSRDLYQQFQSQLKSPA